MIEDKKDLQIKIKDLILQVETDKTKMIEQKITEFMNKNDIGIFELIRNGQRIIDIQSGSELYMYKSEIIISIQWEDFGFETRRSKKD